MEVQVLSCIKDPLPLGQQHLLAQHLCHHWVYCCDSGGYLCWAPWPKKSESKNTGGIPNVAAELPLCLLLPVCQVPVLPLAPGEKLIHGVVVAHGSPGPCNGSTPIPDACNGSELELSPPEVCLVALPCCTQGPSCVQMAPFSRNHPCMRTCRTSWVHTAVW